MSLRGWLSSIFPRPVPIAERPDGVPVEQWPPWKQFPGSGPAEAPVRQGDGERYWVYEWSPFWEPLPPDQKLAYLSAHAAPPNWFHWLKPGGGRDQFDAIAQKLRQP
jgi:hypothetical protein